MLPVTTMVPHREYMEFYIKNIFFGQFSDFSLYGSWEGVDMGKILPQGVGTISTPGKLNSEKLNFSIFLSIFTFSVYFHKKNTLFEETLQNTSLELLPACPQGLFFLLKNNTF